MLGTAFAVKAYDQEEVVDEMPAMGASTTTPLGIWERETIRERETFRYNSSLIAGSDYDGLRVSPERLHTASDSALTAFTLLGALRLSASRAMLSFFDSHTQHVVAEATPAVNLAPNTPSEELWVRGKAVPRATSLCEHVLVPDDQDSPVDYHGISVINDVAADPRFNGQERYHAGRRIRFYAGVPICTRRGINIGVLCVLGDEPRSGLDEASRQILGELSNTIMNYLETKRSLAEHSRAERMVHGVGSFVEGNATMTGWKSTPSAATYLENTEIEGALNPNQQFLQQQDWAVRVAEEAVPPPSATWLDHTSRPVTRSNDQLVLSTGPFKSNEFDPVDSYDRLSTGTNHIFSKAANIIRESIEVEGVLFLDAGISFGGRADSEAAFIQAPRTESSSSDDGTTRPWDSCRIKGPGPCCHVLGFSTTSHSSINGDSSPLQHLGMPEKLLRRLLRRYPKGKIFTFDQSGSSQWADLSGGEESVTTDSTEAATHLSPSQSIGSDSSEPPQLKRRSTLKRDDEKLIIAMFPGARSIAFVPIWDQQKQRWFSGTFAYTKNPMRVLSTRGELSYLTAFGTVIMAEISRLNALLVERSKTDVLNSLSHELRSPLHGIVLGAELLHDTSLDAFQADVLHSVETCGRTLLDTVDHLLDWTKINNFIGTSTYRRSNSVTGREQRGLRAGNNNLVSIEAGMMSIVTQVDVDVLAEEVVETVHAGHSFQKLSASQLTIGKRAVNPGRESLRRLDSMEARESMASRGTAAGDTCFSGITVSLDIEPSVNWSFHTQPGAIRRIIMNLVGNSLKYTDKGFVKVVLDQPPQKEYAARSSTTRLIRITVTDSGRGISEDFLKNFLFVPFSQENTLSSGAGLGLSLVKQITSNLGGWVRVQSKIGKGTTVSVSIPLEECTPTSRNASVESTEADDEFEMQVGELRGLRVLLAGFPTNQGGDAEGGKDGEEKDKHTGHDQRASMANICRNWLHMSVMEPSDAGSGVADLVLCNENHLGKLTAESQDEVSTPAVVVCRNAMVAGKLATSEKFAARAKSGVFGFSSQP